MKITLLFMALVCVSLAGVGQQRKAVFVIVDGIPADLIDKLAVPNLKAIASVGGYRHAIVGGEKGSYSQTPTISAVGYNSILTGTWVNKHNVWDNDIARPNYHYPTIFRLLKEAQPSRKTAIFSTWLDNRTKLVGDNMPATGNIKVDYHFDGMELDTVTYPHDAVANYMRHIDNAVTANAADYLMANGPDLSWIYLEYTDEMGHQFGEGPQYYRAIDTMDAQVGRIWAAIQQRAKAFNEEWMIVITTDHGRDAATGRDHGGQSDRERSGWIVTNLPKLNEHFMSPTLSIVDIMPSIAAFLGLAIPESQAREIDGTPFIGKLAAVDLKCQPTGNKLQLSWTALVKKGDAKIWIATTNDVKTGGTDRYELVKTVPVKAGKAEIDLTNRLSKFYKVVVETAENRISRWVVK